MDPTMVPSPSTMAPSTPRMTELFPALVLCFLVIFLGYCAGKWRLISDAGVSGIARYTGTFALPALLFSEMIALRLDDVEWRFLAAILTSKSLVFFAVLVLTLAILRRRSDAVVGIAGVAAIFATQSNDFALGLPILTAVYDEHYHPEFLQYIYLLAPISLVILNPIGIMLLEWNRNRGMAAASSSSSTGAADDRRSSSLFRMNARVLFGVLSNPIVFMTISGLLVNVIFRSRAPQWLESLLHNLKESYGATALFLLGLTMVDRIKATFSFNNLLLPSLFILAKLIVMPLVNRSMTTTIVAAVAAGGGDSASSNATLTSELSMFGFLYGTFPTAPTVFVIANQYGVETEMFASAVVLCTFLSAPLMYVTAMLYMFSSDLSNVIRFNVILMETGVNVAYLSIVLCLLVCVFLVVTRRFLRLPHAFTLLLNLAVVKMCVGVVLMPHLDTDDVVNAYTWKAGVVSYLVLGGSFDARLTAAMLAVSLCLIAFDVPRRSRICWVMALCCYSVSIIASVLVVHYRRPALITPTLAFSLGMMQTVASIVVILVSAGVIATALVLLVRFLLARTDSSRPSSRLPTTPALRGYGVLPQEEGTETDGDVDDDDDVSLIRESNTSADEGVVGPSQSNLNEIEENAADVDVDDDDPRFVRHIIFLFYSFVGAIVALFLCAWRLEIEMTAGAEAKVTKLTAAFTLTEFMDYVLNFGQGLFIFALFALDTRIIVLPVVRKIRRAVSRFQCDGQRRSLHGDVTEPVATKN